MKTAYYIRRIEYAKFFGVYFKTEILMSLEQKLSFWIYFMYIRYIKCVIEYLNTFQQRMLRYERQICKNNNYSILNMILSFSDKTYTLLKMICRIKWNRIEVELCIILSDFNSISFSYPELQICFLNFYLFCHLLHYKAATFLLKTPIQKL